MHQHALRTAATLYVDGTWTRNEAAKHAGIRPTQLDHAVESFGHSVPPTEESRRKVRVVAD